MGYLAIPVRVAASSWSWSTRVRTTLLKMQVALLKMRVALLKMRVTFC